VSPGPSPSRSLRHAAIGLALGLFLADVVPTPAPAVFAPSSFHEELTGCIGFECDTVRAPGVLVPYSIHVDRTLQDEDNFASVVATAQTTGGVAPAVDVALSYSSHTIDLVEATGTAQIIYEFRVDYAGGGAPPVNTVPLVFIHQLEASATTQGNCEGQADAVLFMNGTSPIGHAEAYFVPNAHVPRGFSSGATLQVVPLAEEQFLALTAEVSVAGTGVCGGSVSAAGDPIIEFDPSFPYASEYEIVVEPGSLQVNPDFEPVPEPAGALLLVTGGLVMLGAWRVRARPGALAADR
jgi:hypothetical protein